MTQKPMTITMNELHMTLIRDISKVIHEFTVEHPEVDSLEVIAVIGCTAAFFISSAPEEFREVAIESVMNSLRDNVEDFAREREAMGH